MTVRPYVNMHGARDTVRPLAKFAEVLLSKHPCVQSSKHLKVSKADIMLLEVCMHLAYIVAGS